MARPIIAVAALAFATAAPAQTPTALATAAKNIPYPHAQALVDGIVLRNPDMLDVILHVSPQADAKNIVIAAHLRKANGEPSGEDDLGVAKTGAPLVEVQKDGVRLGILVQLRDARHVAIGAVGLMYRYAPGDDIEAKVRRSFAIRDALAARIVSRAALAS